MNHSYHNLRHRTVWISWFIFANGLFAMLVGLRNVSWMSIPDIETAAYVAILYPGQFILLAWPGGLPLLALGGGTEIFFLFLAALGVSHRYFYRHPCD